MTLSRPLGVYIYGPLSGHQPLQAHDERLINISRDWMESVVGLQLNTSRHDPPPAVQKNNWSTCQA